MDKRKKNIDVFGNVYFLGKPSLLSKNIALSVKRKEKEKKKKKQQAGFPQYVK